METGIQRNRWIDGLTDQWTDGLNGLITIWQIDRQMDRKRYRLRMDDVRWTNWRNRLIDRQTDEYTNL